MALYMFVTHLLFHRCLKMKRLFSGPAKLLDVIPTSGVIVVWGLLSFANSRGPWVGGCCEHDLERRTAKQMRRRP